MSDLESRLTEALRSESESAPDAVGLAAAARARSRVRRRTHLVALGAGTVAALAIPAAVVAFGGNDGPGRTPVAEDTATASVSAGRWESWHGVTVQVPDEWEYGDQATWCAGGGSVETFRVSRPGVSEMIACTPASSYGLAFQEIDDGEPFDWPVVTQTGEAWPPGTFVGAHGENGVLVTVAGPVREDVMAVLDTVRPIADGVDPHGCSVTDDFGPGMALAGQVPVCRYDSQRRLVQSELLDAEDAAAATEAVRAAPISTAWDDCKNGIDEYVVMGVEGDRVEVQFGGNVSCGDRGVRVEGIRHELTEDVLYWALSPGWSGPFYASVPMPDELRDRPGQ